MFIELMKKPTLHWHALIVELRVNPKTELHDVQPVDVQVRHPGMAPHGTHWAWFKNIPELHWQMPDTRLKLAAVSQVVHDVALVHIKHPISH